MYHLASKKAAAALASSLLLAGWGVNAREFYAGKPVERNGMRIEPSYLTSEHLEASGSHRTGETVYLRADVRSAGTEESHGFPAGSQIPYLGIGYRLTRGGTGYSREGNLHPTLSKAGLEYEAPVRMDGEGTYHLTLIIYPPQVGDLKRHVDVESGVRPWWRPFALTWLFTYPSQPN